MSYPSENIRISPLHVAFSTAAVTSIGAKTRHVGGDFSVLCGVRCSTISTGQSGTVAMNYDFSVMESSAATANGSVIAGATMTLGAATAFVVRGAVSLLMEVASNLATTINLKLNGITYHATAAGATALNGAAIMAGLINGTKPSTYTVKLPHYTAISGFSSANLVLVTADDDQGTGITAETVTGGVQVFLGDLQGVIDVQGSKLSTVEPKYIGVLCTPLTGSDTAVQYAQLITHPSAKPAMPGVKVSCTT